MQEKKAVERRLHEEMTKTSDLQKQNQRWHDTHPQNLARIHPSLDEKTHDVLLTMLIAFKDSSFVKNQKEEVARSEQWPSWVSKKDERWGLSQIRFYALISE